jgi:predicted AAA+ superfamily ATPase
MYIQRVMQPQIEASLHKGYVTTILGPRRVGKTSLVKHLLAKLPQAKCCELNLDHRHIRERISKLELEAIIIESCKQHIGGKEKLWVAIDEAQKCPELFEQIKIIYDEWKDTDQIKFILTGSAHLSLHQLSAETLAGRIELYYLQPFTLRELTVKQAEDVPINSLLKVISTSEPEKLPQNISDEINSILPYRALLQESLQQLLVWGGLPEISYMQDPDEKQSYLHNYIDTYLEQDIRKIETITDLNLYKNLMDIVAQQTGSLRDDNKLLEALGCGRDTLKKYRGYLQATLMYIEIFPYIAAATSKLVKSPKAYMLDNGIISNLTGIYDFNVLTTTGTIGHRFENWFLQELRAWIAQHTIRSEVYFWRLSSGAEVDFVVATKPNSYPFEITFGERPERKKVTNLVKFLREQPQIAWAFYIYNGPFRVDSLNRIIYIPAWCI